MTDEVARQIYPVALSQARTQVVIQLLVLTAFVVLLAVIGFPRQLAWTVGMLTAGGVATAYDVRWWLWLRRADALEAYERIQTRRDKEGGRLRSRVTLIVSLGALLLWLIATQ